jgi:adenine phosphoribosyltransferase
VRKPGKLPGPRISASYALEYGTDTLEMHAHDVPKGAKVLVVDDLLATGGTLKACCDLVERAGGTVGGATVLIELTGLRGRDFLGSRPVHSVLKF